MRKIKPDHDMSIFSHDLRLCGAVKFTFFSGLNPS
jgi:hypothetical protein